MVQASVAGQIRHPDITKLPHELLCTGGEVRWLLRPEN